MAERGVSFTHVFNFRDLGGYRTGDGRYVRWQRLFRSDDLSRLRDDDRDRFAALRIRTVVDLRRPHEIDSDGRVPPWQEFRYHHVHLTHSPWPDERFTDTAHRVRFLVERYRLMSEEARVGIGETLRLIADAEAVPLVFHCMAGKDRTGLISALTLSLLGVSDQDIADDYELSELAEPAVWTYLARIRPDLDALRQHHIIVSPREGMLGFLADLRARYGSVAEYAASVGVTAAHHKAMRDHLLVAAPTED